MSAGSDFRYGARQLWRTPAFALVAILALGIGVGANITIVDTVPLANNTALESLAVRSGDRTAPASGTRVSRGFFQTLGIPLLAGRDFEAGDGCASRVRGHRQ